MIPIAPITTHLKYRRRHQQNQKRRYGLGKIKGGQFEQIFKEEISAGTQSGSEIKC